MSLILDALRKADSERARESVPGLHTQSMQPLSLETARPVRGTPWRWIALGSITLLLAALAWALLGRPAPPAAPERAAIPEPPAMPAPVAAPAPNAVAPNAGVIDMPKDIAPPAPWPEERKPAPRPSARTSGPAEGAVAAPAAAGTPAVYARENLPDSLRGALPPLAVGGSIYSGTPANRSLILDGRLYREGESVATDLVLEEIGQKTAVLRFRGYRFEIRY